MQYVLLYGITLKTYTCACGWNKSLDTLDELLEEIVKHGTENHPELVIDKDEICKYIEDKNKS
jgi:predicted small metal-binding protein